MAEYTLQELDYKMAIEVAHTENQRLYRGATKRKDDE